MGRFGGTKKKSSGAPPQQVERGVGSSRAPISFVYSMKGPDGTTETVRARVRPGELDAFLKYRFFFLRDAATGKRVQELSTFEELKDALETLESSGNSLWLEHPYDGLSERVNNIGKGVTNQANAFEMKSTRAIVKDSEFQAELKTSKLTPVNDGRSVKFCEVTKRGKLLELIEVDGLAMNRDDALLVVNEAKLSPSDKDIGDTVRVGRPSVVWLCGPDMGGVQYAPRWLYSAQKDPRGTLHYQSELSLARTSRARWNHAQAAKSISQPCCRTFLIYVNAMHAVFFAKVVY
jgi:hypothetical protein